MSQDSVDIEESRQLQRQISVIDNNRIYMSLRVAYIIPLIWCANKISMDPLFLYIIVIDDCRRCFATGDWASSFAVRWLLQLFGIAINVACMATLVMRVGLLKKKYEKIIWFLLLLFDLWTYIRLYFPDKQSLQIATFTRPNPEDKNFYLANIYLLEYFSIVILMYIAFTRATRISATLAKATWAKVAFNLVLYIYGGHVFGGLWYAFATVTEIACWMNACSKSSSPNCAWHHFFCDNDHRYDNHTILDEMCPIKTQNTSIYDFGIYYHALESRIVEKSFSLPKKILYCLRWGLQNLSGFGQNLQASTNAWENIFVTSIVIYGVMLFVFFIGNVQRYIQSETEKSEVKIQKKLEIEQSKFFAKLPNNLRKQIKRYPLDEWGETKGVEFQNLFNNLPQDLKKDIKRKLCSDILLTKEEFRPWSRELLDELCDSAKPVSYNEYAPIVQQDSSIDKMLLVVHGEIYSFTINYTGSATTGSSASNGSTSAGSDSIARTGVIIDHPEDGKFCGEELIGWCRNETITNLPISTKTTEAITKVDAFAVMYYNLKKAFIRHQTACRSNQDQAPPIESQP